MIRVSVMANDSLRVDEIASILAEDIALDVLQLTYREPRRTYAAIRDHRSVVINVDDVGADDESITTIHSDAQPFIQDCVFHLYGAPRETSEFFSLDHTLLLHSNPIGRRNRMNIQEAIKSGKPFRRKGWADDYIFVVYEEGDIVLSVEADHCTSIELDVQDILADDWYTRDEVRVVW